MPKKKKKKTGSKKSPKLTRILRSVKTTIKDNKNYARRLTSSEYGTLLRRAYFTKLTPSEVRLNLPNVASNPHFKSAINLTQKKKYDDVYSALTPRTNLSVSINWAIGLLLYQHKLINEFIKLEDKITKSILEEDYTQALQYLDEVDSKCGLSSWSIGIRGSIYGIEHKFEESQKYLQDKIYDESNDNDIFNVVCKYAIDKYDNNSLQVSSGATLRNQIIRSFHSELQHFLIYKIVPRDFSVDYKINYEHVLNYEKNSSLIDIFKVVISFLSSTVDTNDFEKAELAKECIKHLILNIKYHVLDGLSSFYGIKNKWEHKKEDFQLIDEYSAGNYVNVCEIANTKSDRYINFTIFELVAKASARINYKTFNGFKREILEQLAIILLKSSGYQKSLVEVYSICHAFSGLPWFQELHFLISREAEFINEKKHNYLMKLSSVYSEVNSPRKSELLPNSLKKLYFESCNKSINNSLSLRLFEISEDKDINAFKDSIFNNLEKNRILKYKAKILIEIGLIHDAIEILEELVISNDKISAYDGMTLLVDSYIEMDQGEKALELYVTEALKNINIALRFNTFKICKVAEGLIKSSKSICVPIVLSLYNRLVGDDFDSALRYSFERYLGNIGAAKPLDITELEKSAGLDKIHYFLNYVCIPDVMKLSFIFENGVEIEDSRVEICKYLIAQNISKDILGNEVKKITKSQAIRKAVKHVDNSRIYADTSSLRDNRSQSYRDIFELYVELRKKDYSLYSDEKTLAGIYDSFDSSILLPKAHTIYIFGLNLNEKNLTFYKLCSMIRDEFTFGDKGLNRYLSTRIRHGVLPNKIRDCASIENLVTALQETTKLPKSNFYWKNRLELSSPDTWNEIDKLLSKFTLDFDEILNEVNDQWLQIVSLDQDIKNLQKGGSKTKALFNYSLSLVETYMLQRTIDDSSDYDDFINVALDWLWKRTELNLKRVKDNISTNATNRFMKCYDSLFEATNKIASKQNCITELQDAITRSKHLLSSTLDSIIPWFTRAEVDEVKEFEISTAIDIAARSTSVNVNIINDYTNQINGTHLTSFVDIFYILFENAVSKSYLSNDELIINITFDDKDDDLQITVENNCVKITDSDIRNKKLNYYRDAYGNEELINEVVQQEGGTGLFKIWKILSRDIELEHELTFEYINDETFVLVIKMKKISGILIDENTSN